MKLATVDNVKEAWDVRVSDVNDLWIPVGRINSAGTLAVDQKFYFDEEADNTYQRLAMTLDITFYADQVNAPGPAHTTRGLVLENKNVSTDWSPIVADGIWGILTWDGAGVYTGKAWGMNSDTYKLTYWNEATSGPEVTIGSTQTGTDLTFTGTYAAFNTNLNAKYWVRPNVWSGSSNANSLFEANLVN